MKQRAHILLLIGDVPAFELLRPVHRNALLHVPGEDLIKLRLKTRSLLRRGLLIFFFNNNDFIPTTVLDYCTEMDQPFLNVLLRGNSQLARQA